ncbi:beta-methylmalyl-CoA dehydratase-like [Ylistrum balloti]|uniref:beta-methylmalyl-CoA dehydratase-like n=1 Tax=Ylistrum balloti TaxID=509963 RepID=UPI002905936C|nr:beta-methylmalyl-CoA dehydratase-like [Ylistrum balloti]
MDVIRKQTGHFLEDFTPGQLFRHKRGKTITAGLFNDFTDFSFTTNPLSKNNTYATLYGFKSLVCPPGLVMNVVFSQTVEDISENARANLGYKDMCFGAPLYIGDTIEVETKILEIIPSSKNDDRGVVTVQSTGRNQHGNVVLTFQRSVQIWKRDSKKIVEHQKLDHADLVEAKPVLPDYDHNKRYSDKAYLTTSDSYFEDFKPGTLLEHSRGRVVTDEHIALTGKLDNTSQVHCNQYLIDANPGKYLGGKLLVYGGIPFNLCLGLSCADIGENALSDVCYASGKHTAPIFVGDTVFCSTEIKTAAPYPEREDLGLLTTVLRGYKMQRQEDDGSWQRIQIFELERQLAIKRRSHYA